MYELVLIERNGGLVRHIYDFRIFAPSLEGYRLSDMRRGLLRRWSMSPSILVSATTATDGANAARSGCVYMA